MARPEGQLLPYDANSETRLRTISRSQSSTSVDQGLIVLSFSLPGFNFDHKKAVVFISAELRYGKLAGYYSGKLLYLKKVDGKWIKDDDSSLPDLITVT